jgi:Protein of unknown function (DUF3611)
MLRASTGASPSSKTDTLAMAFSRLGWIGFWVQVVLGAIPIILMVYAFLFTTAPTTRSAPSRRYPWCSEPYGQALPPAHLASRFPCW